MPLSKAGKKIKASLEKQYGEKKGEEIFYAMENKGEIPGMKKKTGYNVGGQVPKQPSQVGAMQTKQANEAKLLATRPTQVGSMQAQQAAMSRRQSMSSADTTTNQRNMALAQRNMAAKTQGTPASKTPRKNMNPLSNRRGFAEGGMVKSTSKMNTGIKKCGE